MTKKISLYVFFTCLFACAAIVLYSFVFAAEELPQEWFRAAASLFVIGLTAFLIWFVAEIKAIHSKIAKGE
ncbi:MAG: hypothetical protein A3G59_01825 [Candidatus Taylorbacteria bacterium RIFCSPLOWO2_12_FULL_47_20]|uniref:Uncharacterized protein n=2 Tax=Candidatus Tayloriibacteriota TaxID=1817919 RepID=A0A1G2PAD3_9BACT|nr:MAG: hypothetical protein A3H68_02115 [Candidatus Taylorbacteria bacterium RIFCSPLOWO2_02_FULL_46_40]OHA45288.1 MAG: hypothetical protein A3G59_01825 [Candidatus Taylorbacteria bacterium RIFCSPLOWO2_12_FULL_47_20]